MEKCLLKILKWFFKKTYSGKSHPDIKLNRKSEDEIFAEFIESIDMFNNLNCNKLNYMTESQFLDYYKIVSSSIENENEFDNIINGTWRLL